MNTKDKILEWLRGERDWEQRDMARECLAEIERSQPAAPQVPEGWQADSMAYLARKLRERGDDLSLDAASWLDKLCSTPPAPEQPKPAETREQRRASALTFSDTSPEVGFIADGERLNCPACGGSGHVDDVQPKPAGDVEADAARYRWMKQARLSFWVELASLKGGDLDAAIDATRLAAQPTQGEPKYTTGHCENHKQPGGCQLHNLHCRYPECDRKPAQGEGEK